MNNKSLERDGRTRIKILNSGEVVDGVGIGAADTLEQSKRWNDPKHDKHNNFYDTPAGKAQSKEVDACWARHGDGVWVEAHGRRYTLKTECEDLHTPFDKKNREIFVGDVIVYAMRDLTVSELKVEKIQCGFDTTLYGTDLHTGKKTKNSHPERCLKVSS